MYRIQALPANDTLSGNATDEVWCRESMSYSCIKHQGVMLASVIVADNKKASRSMVSKVVPGSERLSPMSVISDKIHKNACWWRPTCQHSNATSSHEHLLLLPVLGLILILIQVMYLYNSKVLCCIKGAACLVSC